MMMREILDLRMENEHLSQRFTQATNRLWSQGADRDVQTKYTTLEKFRELAAKKHSREVRLEEVEKKKSGKAKEMKKNEKVEEVDIEKEEEMKKLDTKEKEEVRQRQ